MSAYVNCINSGDARLIPGGTCDGIYTKKSDQISEHMLQAAGYLGGIFYEHMHQNAAEGISLYSSWLLILNKELHNIVFH